MAGAEAEAVVRGAEGGLLSQERLPQGSKLSVPAIAAALRSAKTAISNIH